MSPIQFISYIIVAFLSKLVQSILASNNGYDHF